MSVKKKDSDNTINEFDARVRGPNPFRIGPIVNAHLQVVKEIHYYKIKQIHILRKGKNGARITKHKHQYCRIVQKTYLFPPTFY